MFGWGGCKWWERVSGSNIPQSDKLSGRCGQLSCLSPPGFILNLPHFRRAFREKREGRICHLGVHHLSVSVLALTCSFSIFASLGLKRVPPFLALFLSFFIHFFSLSSSYSSSSNSPCSISYPCLLLSVFLILSGFLFSSLSPFSPL